MSASPPKADMLSLTINSAKCHYPTSGSTLINGFSRSRHKRVPAQGEEKRAGANMVTFGTSQEPGPLQEMPRAIS